MSWFAYAAAIGLRGSSPRNACLVAFDWTMHVLADNEARAQAVLLWKRLNAVRLRQEGRR